MTSSLVPFDSLAPCPPGVWSHGSVTVVRVDTTPTGDLLIERRGDALTVSHTLTPERLSEALVGDVTDRIAARGFGQDDFEAVMVGLVRSTVDDPIDAWATYYRNSMNELLSGAAEFAPIHSMAESSVVGSVLDLGSCFGFFPLRLASQGVTVTATDIHEGTIRLLDAMRGPLGIDLETLVCDGGAVPVPDGHADTVTALHLLEHVDEALGDSIVREALRIARRRVVLAVPFEDEAQACHGHVRTFDPSSLTALAERSGVGFEVFEHHGGWAVLDRNTCGTPNHRIDHPAPQPHPTTTG